MKPLPYTVLMPRARLPYLLIPLAALIAIAPLLLNGCSCGHDFDFHLLNWFEAAHQFAHGNLHPHWAYTAAFNAGEPRFVFYPPLSWTIGAILGLLFPWPWTPILYTWLALTAAGLALHRLARDFATPNAALLAAIFYTVNPYLLFTAYERTAYAELLAAAWIPLLLYAILRPRVTIPRIAIPLALLWLTNAPAAVMSSYTLALLTVIRLITYPRNTHEATLPQSRLSLARNTLAGTALGLTLPAFYLIPAAYQRRYVQIKMAILEGLRIQDNFLFHHLPGHTPDDLAHDTVLHTASLIALLLLTFTTITLILIAVRPTKPGCPISGGSTPGVGLLLPPSPSTPKFNPALLPLAILTATIAFLLTPLSAPIWKHAPELVFLQFPWRLLAILTATLSLTLATALSRFTLRPTRTSIIALIAAAALTLPAYKAFHQPCDPEDTVAARLTLFHSNQGSEPTDEYTPLTADNDALTHTNPPYWLAPSPTAKAPTAATPGPAPTHLTLTPTEPTNLILNLRDYPTWTITSTDSNSQHLNHPPHLPRADGLIAIPLYYAAEYTIEITQTRPLDQTLGNLLSATALALLTLILTLKRPNEKLTTSN